MDPTAASPASDPSAAMAISRFDTPVPVSAEEWETRKAALRPRLWRLFGDVPPTFTPQPRVLETTQQDGYTLQRVAFENGVGSTVYGLLCVPDGRTQPGPAVLYQHCHGWDYANGKGEILGEGLYGPQVPDGITPARALTAAGYVVLAVDAYAFGERQYQVPARLDDGKERESALFKKLLWEGRTLWGMMMHDDLLALNALVDRPDVDPARIGIVGFSMGSTRAWWLAAMDERIKATIAVGCLTRYQQLVEHGLVNQHGLFYFVPGMLKEQIDMEAVLGLIAPRPLLTLTGDRDEGSPVDGVRRINAFLADLYRLYGHESSFEGVVYDDTGHVYTEDMWRRTVDWFQRHL